MGPERSGKVVDFEDTDRQNYHFHPAIILEILLHILQDWSGHSVRIHEDTFLEIQVSLCRIITVCSTAMCHNRHLGSTRPLQNT
jgi:hypothetical protein